MGEWEQDRLAAKAASLYYLENCTQEEIAKKLGIHRTTISRLLKAARQEGIITIQIRDDLNTYHELEGQLETAFGLKAAYVVSDSSVREAGSENQALGKACAEYLYRITQDGDVIGLSWGSALQAVSEVMVENPAPRTIDADVVAICGGPGNMESRQHVNSIVGSASKALRARPHYFYAPIITSKKATKEAILEDENYQMVTSLWEKINIAVFGIGAFPDANSVLATGYVSPRDLEELSEQQAVGDICSRFFDINGQLLCPQLMERTIGIDLAILRQIPYAIAVAGSQHKISAILGALHGGFINVLMTTEAMARNLLESKNV